MDLFFTAIDNGNGEQRIGRTYGATAPVLDPTGKTGHPEAGRSDRVSENHTMAGAGGDRLLFPANRFMALTERGQQTRKTLPRSSGFACLSAGYGRIFHTFSRSRLGN